MAAKVRALDKVPQIFKTEIALYHPLHVLRHKLHAAVGLCSAHFGDGERTAALEYELVRYRFNLNLV
jgi:hypothetical protein